MKELGGFKKYYIVALMLWTKNDSKVYMKAKIRVFYPRFLYLASSSGLIFNELLVSNMHEKTEVNIMNVGSGFEI